MQYRHRRIVGLPPQRRRRARSEGQGEERDDVPTRKFHDYLERLECPTLFFRAASNSSPGFQVTGGAERACHPSKNPNCASLASARKSISARYSSAGRWYRSASYSAFCCFPQPSGWPAKISPSSIEKAGTPTRARLKWSER